MDLQIECDLFPMIDVSGPLLEHLHNFHDEFIKAPYLNNLD
jgi:hypothetical protein